jgi:hypothetical protein
MKLWKPALLLTVVSAPLFAGALTLQIEDSMAVPEAKAMGAVLTARITACHSPEKTVVKAIAEGIVDGKRESIAVNVVPLSTPGTFAIKRDWPSNGNWVIRLVASNPDYKNYKTGLIVSMSGDVIETASVKHFSREPLSQDADELLKPTAI